MHLIPERTLQYFVSVDLNKNPSLPTDTEFQGPGLAISYPLTEFPACGKMSVDLVMLLKYMEVNDVQSMKVKGGSPKADLPLQPLHLPCSHCICRAATASAFADTELAVVRGKMLTQLGEEALKVTKASEIKVHLTEPWG